MDVITRHPIHYELYEYDNKYYYGDKHEHLRYVEFMFNDITVNVDTNNILFEFSNYLKIDKTKKIYDFTSYEYNQYLLSLEFDLPISDLIIKLEWLNYINFYCPYSRTLRDILYYLFEHINNSNITLTSFEYILTLIPNKLHFYVKHYYFTYYILKINVNPDQLNNIIDFYIQYNINIYCEININNIKNLRIVGIAINCIMNNTITYNHVRYVHDLAILEKINEYNLTSFMEYLKNNISTQVPLIISTIIFKKFNLFKLLVNETNVNMNLDNNYTTILHLMTYNNPEHSNKYEEWIDYIITTLNADCTLCNIRNETALQLAYKYNRTYMIQELSKLNN